MVNEQKETLSFRGVRQDWIRFSYYCKAKRLPLWESLLEAITTWQKENEQKQRGNKK